MSYELRGKISDTAETYLRQIEGMLGSDRTMAAVEHLIVEAYFKLSYANDPGAIYAKAARVLTRLKGLGSALNASDIEKVVFRGSGITVYTRFSAEGFLIKAEDWQ